jgi:hypothetical protein
MFFRNRKIERKIDLLNQRCIITGYNCPPPPQYKQRTLSEYAEYYQCRTFVETGTYSGDTTEAMQPYFERLYTIELGEELFEKAKTRLKKFNNVKCYLGDSSTVLPGILAEIDKKALFWLDAHYSGGITACGNIDTPILAELAVIIESAKKFKHVILIDDARCFGFDKDYPSIFVLKNFIKDRDPKACIEHYDDIIRIVF